jgi:hypothetical protein
MTASMPHRGAPDQVASHRILPHKQPASTPSASESPGYAGCTFWRALCKSLRPKNASSFSRPFTGIILPPASVAVGSTTPCPIASVISIIASTSVDFSSTASERIFKSRSHFASSRSFLRRHSRVLLCIRFGGGVSPLATASRKASLCFSPTSKLKSQTV